MSFIHSLAFQIQKPAQNRNGSEPVSINLLSFNNLYAKDILPIIDSSLINNHYLA